jgi:hypothetical protein
MAAVTYDRAGADDTEGEELAPGVMLLYDGAGRIIGIEITAASKTLGAGALDRLPRRLPALGEPQTRPSNRVVGRVATPPVSGPCLNWAAHPMCLLFLAISANFDVGS